jgi:hypothetical protein
MNSLDCLQHLLRVFLVSEGFEDVSDDGIWVIDDLFDLLLYLSLLFLLLF